MYMIHTVTIHDENLNCIFKKAFTSKLDAVRYANKIRGTHSSKIGNVKVKTQLVMN